VGERLREFSGVRLLDMEGATLRDGDFEGENVSDSERLQVADGALLERV
jgi:hypothetical protein